MAMKNEDGTFCLQFRMDNVFADFNVLGFIKNAFYYRKKLKRIHTAIAEAFYKYWILRGESVLQRAGRIQEAVMEYEERTKKSSLLGAFENWKAVSMEQSGGKQQGMLIPIQHVDIYLNLLNDASAWSKRFFQNQNPLARAWIYLGEICSHLQEYLGKVEKLYDSDEGIFTRSFENCPIIDYIINYTDKGFAENISLQFADLIRKCSRFYEGEDNTIMKDQIQLGTDPDLREVM